MARERIGILGGTFDPIHNGHIAMARAALRTARLDRLLVLPTGNPPHKTGVTPAEDRWRMVCAALSGEDGLEPDRMELDRPGVIYTVDTLHILHERYPKAELFYLIGADTLPELKNWRNYTEVLGLCTFLVCPRPWDVQPAALLQERERLTALGGRFITVDMPVVDISSTVLREALSCGDQPEELPAVCGEYAALAGLYSLQPRWPEAPRWLEKLFTALNPARFAHSLGVAQTARRLALLHGVDPIRAEQAGLLHDCAKYLPLKQMQALCRTHVPPVDLTLYTGGGLMHGPAGSVLAQAEYGVADAEILRAIDVHTTADPDMSPLDMIVYLSDKIEPGRRGYPLLGRTRMLASLDLKRAMIASLEGTKTYFESKPGKQLHPVSLAALRQLKSETGK